MLRAARPASNTDDQPVMVRIHYMVGDHDWFYHLPGEGYAAVRQKLVEQMGLANRADRPFPHDITESDELLQTMRRHKVTARHGDAYDPLSFEGDRDLSCLGDARHWTLSAALWLRWSRVMVTSCPMRPFLAFARSTASVRCC